MKAVLASIRKEWLDMIMSGEKTIEIRKSFPKKIDLPFICYLYESKGNGGSGKVLARIRVDERIDVKFPFIRENELDICKRVVDESKVTCAQIHRYQKRKACYGWHISEAEKFNKHKDVTEYGLKRAPQSWCYVEVNV